MINCEHVSVSDTRYWNGTMRKANVVAPRRWWINGSERAVRPIAEVVRASSAWG